MRRTKKGRLRCPFPCKLRKVKRRGNGLAQKNRRIEGNWEKERSLGEIGELPDTIRRWGAVKKKKKKNIGKNP